MATQHVRWQGHSEGAYVVGKGHSKLVSAVGERHNKVVYAVGAVGKCMVASGGIGEKHLRRCMCSCKGHRELDSARERICTFPSSRLKEPKKDLLLNEVARNVEV